MNSLNLLKDFEDVAIMLGVTKEQLKNIIVYNKRNQYTEFEIFKKMGLKERSINLKIL
ncbi:hypothetical protein [Desemzia sp. FAM 23988]|uniref:hypothetical protein n=1 Tax=unclassified Desemzia TaxID=2685243 RepID=UPI0038864BA9